MTACKGEDSVRLFVQIPCLNEEKTLGEVIRDIPRVIDRIDNIKVLVIDDGSSDRTAEVAYKEGADYVIRLPFTQGLAKAFSHGIESCLDLGADIIVNTDGDHQYQGEDISRLIQPILDGRAEVVIGNREVANIDHFSPLKKKLQVLGSIVVSILSRVNVPDATSGFRAYSREAALRMNVFSNFSYTLETLFLAGNHRIPIAHIPIKINRPKRPSRLFSSLLTYLKKSFGTIVRIYTLYEPLRSFFYFGSLVLCLGILTVMRFLWYYFSGMGAGHIQSLILSGVLMTIGFQMWVLGILADLISISRKISEEILYRMKRSDNLIGQQTNTAKSQLLRNLIPSKKARTSSV
jgi:glycosyltransferase involved in cell wall biosynthesis